MFQDSQESDKMAVNGHATIGYHLVPGYKLHLQYSHKRRQDEERPPLHVIGGGHGWLERAYLW